LAIQSPEKGCGKTTLLEIIATLVPRGETSSSITAATIFRLIEARRPTLLIDEADRVLRSSNEELIAVLNSSHRRSGAYVWRVEEVARQRVPTRFSTWGAVAFAGIRELPETLQDRSIVFRLPRALPGEVRAHLSDGTSSVLRTIKAKLARWTVDLRHLPEPKLPAGLHNRLGDNWRPLVALADLAGGRWPELIRTAASSSLSADQEEGQLIALLRGIRRALGEKDFLETQALIDSLIADDEHDWETANNHKPVNAAWLRWRLRGVLAPKEDGTFGSDRRGSGKKERGYFRHRFEDAWSRYTPSILDPQNTRSTRSTMHNDQETNENNGPDTDEDTRPKSDTRSAEVGNGGPGNATDGPGTGPGKEDVPGPEEHQRDEELTPNKPDRPGISGDADSESPPDEDSFPNVRRPGNAADSDWEPL
jgi:putative DNA primase/helicase